MRIAFLLAATLAPTAALAQTNPTTVTPIQFNGTYAQNFDTLAASGSTGTALPQGFQIVETGGNSSYAVSSGSSNAGGSYSFGATGSTERALGSIGSGSIAPIYYGGILTNALGATITSVTLDYFGEQWRRTDSTDDGLTFQYRLGATDVGGQTGWTTVAALAFTPLFTTGTGTALDGNATANRRGITGTISGLSLLSGQNFGFRWVDENSNGSGDQGLAIDNLTITGAAAVTPGAVPEPATWAIMLLGFGVMGYTMRRRATAIGRVRVA